MGGQPFKKGYDSRRGKQRIEIAQGMSLSEIAQLHSKEAIDMLASFVNNTELDGTERTDGKKYPSAARVRSCEIILAYAHGKPETIVKLQEISRNQAQSLSHVPTERLLDIIEGELVTQDT